MKTYIVTGGAGFIGSALAKRLIEGGKKVYILDDLSTGFEKNIPTGCIFYKVDISDRKRLFDLQFPDKVDCVFHLAAQSSGEASFDDPCRDIDVNYKATYNILELCSRYNCERFIYASSMSVYGDVKESEVSVSEEHSCKPVSCYGVNKLASEKLTKMFVRKTNIKATILRLFNVYGPGQNMANMKQGMVSIYFSYLINNMPINVKGSIFRFRDFIYIDDVINVFIDCENRKEAYGEIFNLGTGVKTTVEGVLKIILKAYGNKDFDKWVYMHGSTSGDIFGLIADASKLKKILKWEPKQNLECGILKMKNWIEENSNSEVSK
ncbi:NAD-dependent epimerase/dehydratase family protein [Candidatus Omnitrophota bacterium]